MSPEEHDIMRAVEDRYWWYQALRKEVSSMICPPRPNFELLDAGCGSGGMLAVIAQQFPSAKLVGMDVSKHAVELTNRRAIDASLTTGSVNALPFPDSQFDFVLSLDVLTDRGVNDRDALRESHRVLRRDGQLIVNVAALEFLRGSHDVAVDTERRYVRSQLASLLREAGFCVDRLTYWNMTLLPLVALVRWRSRKTPNLKAKSDFSAHASWVNSLMAGLLGLEFKLSSVVSLPLGSSLLAHARKL